MRPCEPMLACSTRAVPKGDYLYEPKLDGFRALVSTVNGLRVTSRRGWPMDHMVSELAALPGGLVLDGELVGDGGGPQSFPLVCRRMLHGDRTVPVRFAAFDLLAVDGCDLTRQPYLERRRLLDALNLEAAAWTTVPAVDDGEALWRAVCEHGLEGVVAKRRLSTYRSGRCAAWQKIKNGGYWRRESELNALKRSRRATVPV